jgi:ABC-type multidrug transport system fused ATPase/permease subunit
MRIRYRLAEIDLPLIGRIFVRFGEHLHGHRTRLLVSTLSIFGVALVTLLQPWPLKIVFDFILMPERAGSSAGPLAPLASLAPMTILWMAAAAVLVLAVLKGLFNYSHNVFSKVVSHKLIAEIRLRLFSHVQRLPQSYHDYRETGELMTRMTGDLTLLVDLLVTTIITLSSQLLLVLGMLAVMFWLDWALALLTLAVLPFFVLAAFKFSGRIKSSARRQREMYGKIVASVQESFAGIQHIKGFGQERTRERLIGKSIDRDVQANVKTTKLAANYARTVELINAVGTGLVLLFGTLRAISGTISPGDLLIFLAYMRGMYRPLQQVAKLTTKVAKATARGEMIMELLDMKAEVDDREDAISARDIVGDIRFENVRFSYVTGRQVLTDFSCRIPSSKTTAIVGPTGAGKSTIAKLILRLYEPNDGMVYVDGHNIADYRIKSLRKRVTPLAQEAFLFRTGIGENIAFGKRRASQEEIEAAAQLAGAHEFITSLPDGYDTLVGEGGLTLSGGQRQRISFARAALRESPIMIFDEPATGLDVHAEQAAKEVLGKFRIGRSLIIITHRLHFLDLVDWVVFIVDGRVMEEGTLADLIAHRGPFHSFVTNADPAGKSLRWLDALVGRERGNA